MVQDFAVIHRSREIFGVKPLARIVAVIRAISDAEACRIARERGLTDAGRSWACPADDAARLARDGFTPRDVASARRIRCEHGETV